MRPGGHAPTHAHGHVGPPSRPLGPLREPWGPRLPAILVLLTVLAPTMAGCIGPGELAPELPSDGHAEGPRTAADLDDATQGPATDAAEAAPADDSAPEPSRWALDISWTTTTEGPYGPVAPNQDGSFPGTPIELIITVTPLGPAPGPGTLAVLLDVPTVPDDGPRHGPRADASERIASGHDETISFRVAQHLPPGHHVLTGDVGWVPDGPTTNSTSAPPSTWHPLSPTNVTVLAGLRLLLNASHAWYPDQATFDTQHLAPYVPGPDGRPPRGYALLTNASLHHDFAVDAPYRADLGAHYVRGINGTQEVWCDLSACSYSWMIHLNGDLADRAIDHIEPDTTDTLELRYMRCYSTGRCEDPGALD